MFKLLVVSYLLSLAQVCFTDDKKNFRLPLRQQKKNSSIGDYVEAYSQSKITRKIINTYDAPILPLPLNQAIVAYPFVFVSGCVGMDKDNNNQIVVGGIVPETIQTLKNLVAVLKASGSRVENVVKTNVYLQSMDDFTLFNQEYQKVFSKDFPARTSVQVAKLPVNAKVEIEVTALVGDIETVYC